LAGLFQDVRYAIRQLRKSPGFAITAILMLALGICANSTVFSWINGTLLHPVPGARDTGALVTIMRGTWNNSPSPPLSYLDYRDLRDTNHTFTDILAYHDDWLMLTGGSAPERVYGAKTTANYFDLLGVKPSLGRFFLPGEDEQQTGVPYLVLGFALWQSHFAGDPSIIGRSIEINRLPFTVIGVAPPGFIGSKTGIRTDLWMPLGAYDQLTGNGFRLSQRGNAWLNVMGRLRPGVSRADATQNLEVLMRRLVATYPDDHPGVNTVTLDPLWRSPFGANVFLASSLLILLSVAGIVLLLTSVNVATLALVRFVARRKEIAIRKALGAGRIGLMRQMVLEGILVSLGGGVVASLLTAWSAKTMAAFVPPSVSPILLNGSVDGGVWVAILVLAALSSVICGVLPAWKSSRVSSAEVLKEEAASVSSGTHHRRLLSGLVVAQIALSLALLVTAGLFLRTLRAAVEADPGFEQDHVLVGTVETQPAGFSDVEMRVFQKNLLSRLQALPGVRSAALSDWIPLSFTRATLEAYPVGYVPQLHESREVRRASVSEGYFATMGIPLLEGRAISADDGKDAPPVAVINQTMAERWWPRRSPLSQRFSAFGRLYTVVGVARDSKHQSVQEAPEPMVYLALFQKQNPQTILQVRTEGDPNALASAVDGAVHGIDARVVLFDLRSMRDSTRMASIFMRIEATFGSIFGMLALVLATTGIYGVVAYRTQLRTHEIGIRVALGAGRWDVLKLVLYQGLQLTAIGLAVGLIFAYVLTRFLRGMLYGVSANDPLTAACVTALLAAIAVVACCLPAIRATKVDPVAAIRAQ